MNLCVLITQLQQLSFHAQPFLKNTYLYIWLHRVLIEACGIFIATCGIFVAACGIFSCGVRTLSCSMWDLVS